MTTSAEEMGDAYPELRRDGERVAEVLQAEEERFVETHRERHEDARGGALAGRDERKMLDGETAFKLYDTYGFPLDLTADICRERGVAVDEAGFERGHGPAADQARAAGKFKMAAGAGVQRRDDPVPRLRGAGARRQVVALYRDGTAVERH